jgi:hypothetical protein
VTHQNWFRRAVIGLGIMCALAFGYTVAGYHPTVDQRPVAAKVAKTIEPEAEASCQFCQSGSCDGVQGYPNCCNLTCGHNCVNFQNDVNNCGGCGVNGNNPRHICDPATGGLIAVTCDQRTCREVFCDGLCSAIQGYTACREWTCYDGNCSASGCGAVANGPNGTPGDCTALDTCNGSNPRICLVAVRDC